ncbi:MAG: fused MFS/spermidine synthase [Planctomycetota bacterium]
MAEPTRSAPAIAISRFAFPLFFSSGACALVYQTVWVRQLTLSFGISIYAVSAVLSAFMFGLCIGAYTIGRMSDRIRNPLRAYGYCELAIAAYAAALYFGLADGLPWLLRSGHAWLPSGTVGASIVRFAIAFVLLLLPTILMGGTLPLLARTLMERTSETGERLGLLYGINTLGAVLGTGLAGFWLLEKLGIFGTTVAAVVFNLALAVLAIYVARTHEPVRVAPQVPRSARPPRAIRSGIVELVIFLSGFAALSYEIIWNRTLLLYVHNSTYAFSMILIVFLLGVALGSLVYSRLPARWTNIRVLGALQLALATYVWLSIYLTGELPGILERVADVIGTQQWASALATMATAAIVIVFVPTFVMGMTFPMATALCADDADELGSRIGNSYGFVTFGNILGSVVTGFLLIGWLGLRNAITVAIGFNLVGGFLLLFYRPKSPLRIALSLGCTALAVSAILWNVDRDVFRRFYEVKYPKILFYKEEVTDTVMVVELPGGTRGIRYSDGRGTAGTGTEIPNRLYGHLPCMLHPDPRSILSICFGVGNTLSALAQYQPDRFVCVELSPGAVEAASYFPTNRDVLRAPNLEMHIEDGRNFLLTNRERFDVIQLEPPEIHSATVVNLYTREFYELAREHMTDDGVICQWINVILLPEREMKMLIRTFLDVFPQGSAWSGSGFADLLLIGSPKTIRFTPAEIQARFDAPLVRADLERIGFRSPIELLSLHMMGPDDLAKYVAGVRSITDDWTYVDFSVPQSREAGFGVFIGHNLHSAPPPVHHQRIADHSILMATRKSPAYMIDDSGADDAGRIEFWKTLEADLQKRRDDARERLRGMNVEVGE